VAISYDGTRTVFVRDIGTVETPPISKRLCACDRPGGPLHPVTTCRCLQMDVVNLVKENLPSPIGSHAGREVSYEFDQSPM